MPRTPLSPPPNTWPLARRVAGRILAPIERFMRVEASSGIVLLVAAVVALAWANSPWASSYQRLWHTPVTFGLGSFVHVESLHFWINDGLMTVFFLVVGLEIRRELHEGELSDPKRAALPVAAAVGGMIVPALIYLALSSPDIRRGWGVPTATDIAFAVGALALLGKRIPPALRILLLALAIIDDIGAIILIALFYSSGVKVAGILIAGVGVVGIVILQRLGLRRAMAYAIPGAVIWLGMLRAGIHPTIAGVLIGLLTPVTTWFGREEFLTEAGEALEDFRETTHDRLEAAQPLQRLKQAHREALPPVTRVQANLHPWVAYGIMPLFALSNAGVSLAGLDTSSSGFTAIATAVLLGLVVGKPIGIVAASALTVKLGICALPRGVTWLGVLLVGCVAGIGFTMAIFIAGLAFESPTFLGAAKVGILLSSTAAAVIGLAVGRIVTREPVPEGAAETLEQAESSTEQ